MANRKVRAGATYIYYPVLMDRIHPPYGVAKGLVPGTLVTVVNMHGCPRANSMGHAHIMLQDKTFAGLVCTNSLYPMADKQLVIDALKRDAEKMAVSA